jgi:hypothetical protein
MFFDRFKTQTCVHIYCHKKPNSREYKISGKNTINFKCSNTVKVPIKRLSCGTNPI